MAVLNRKVIYYEDLPSANYVLEGWQDEKLYWRLSIPKEKVAFSGMKIPDWEEMIKTVSRLYLEGKIHMFTEEFLQLKAQN